MAKITTQDCRTRLAAATGVQRSSRPRAAEPGAGTPRTRSEALVPRPIRRTGEPPDFTQDDADFRGRRAREVRIAAADGLTFRYRCSRPWRIGENGCVVRRRIFCWALTGEERVGALEFAEFEPDPGTDSDDFFDTMDTEYSADAALAQALCGRWKHIGPSVSDFGPILEFRSAWMAPSHARGGIWAKAAGRIIEAASPNHSILVMKAFPLEYTGKVATPEIAAAFRARRAAMVRYYERLFGVEPLPGPARHDGWLWRPNPRKEDLLRNPLDETWAPWRARLRRAAKTAKAARSLPAGA